VPNWCENRVVFRGSPDNIGMLKTRLINPVKIVKEGWLHTLSFDQAPWEYGDTFVSDLSPGSNIMSRTLLDIDKNSVDRNWMVDNLGTKWDFEINDFEPCSDASVGGYFNSAWSPPTGWFIQICKKYNLLGELSYGEGGNDYAGILEIADTSIIQYCSPYNEWAQLQDESPEYYLEALISDADEYPEFIQAMKAESLAWPKDWASYKEKFIESTAQK
jgi:hypothetical protein